MPLINCKIELSLKWVENCVLTSAAIGTNANTTGADTATFKITDAQVYVAIVTLSAEDNAKLSKLLGEGFKRPVYWNKYKVIDNTVVEIAANNAEKHIREFLDQFCIDSFSQYFLPRFKIENYNIKMDGRNFYGQPINGSLKQYDGIMI